MNIYTIDYRLSYMESKKDLDKYLGLTIICGALGVHKFYVNKYLTGIIYLLLCWTGITLLFSIYDIFTAAREVHRYNLNLSEQLLEQNDNKEMVNQNIISITQKKEHSILYNVARVFVIIALLSAFGIIGSIGMFASKVHDHSTYFKKTIVTTHINNNQQKANP